ncbi:MAG: kelch repeat-containing protein [Gemmatimonadales bacterium]|nr:kelch repeat-containing protein [Gemmatimonadales bacterium]
MTLLAMRYRVPIVAGLVLTLLPRTPAKEIVPLTAMRVARMAHTATPLADNRVLVAGGFTDPRHASASAELFDARSARLVALPPMVTLRHSHTATRLPDGKVLLIGGYVAGNSVTASAELFDPVTQRFTPTGRLGAARAGHVAVPLANGKVLVAGGVGPNWTFLKSAELYDPVSGRFTPTGDMTVARESHVAVRLLDGGVLIAGGHRDRRAAITIYASAERYDVTTGRFRAVGDMTVHRHKHDGVLLADGRVLITGGSDERDDRGMYDSSELFDPHRGTFAAGPRLIHRRYKHAGSSVLLPSGEVLIAGGAPEAERFLPTRGEFAPVRSEGSLSGQFSAVATLGDGGVLITGGYGLDRGPQATVWKYR